ncbi:MAG: 16S rRNA (guanine(966)-N(2))-methyltransferase RsmD [Pseudomonadota bacterium]
MRIIGGAFGGRRLAGLGQGDPFARLRPTSDRVRESLFNVLMSRHAERLVEARVLDLFAGSGALGLEALSRGAQEALFVENGRAALRLLRDNIARCEVENRASVLARDARRLGDAPGTPYDLVFLDPPYGRSLGEAALDVVLQGGWIARDALVIWEEGGPVQAPPELDLQDERRSGGTFIRIYGLRQRVSS